MNGWTVLPFEDVLTTGDIGLSQIARGLDTPNKIFAQSVISRLSKENEMIPKGNLVKQVKKKFAFTDSDLEFFEGAFLDHIFSEKKGKLYPTKLGNIMQANLPEDIEAGACVYEDFTIADRIGIIRELSHRGAVDKSKLRSIVRYEGSLNHNLETLQKHGALDVKEDSVLPAEAFNRYVDELDRLEEAVAEVRRSEDRPVSSLRAYHLMTDKSVFVYSPQYESLIRATVNMMEQDVQAILVPGAENEKVPYYLLTKFNALRAYADGKASNQLSELRKYLVKPIEVKIDFSAQQVLERMTDQGSEAQHAIVMSNPTHEVEGIISLADLIYLFKFYRRF
jgi:hypothetical protein